MCLNPITLNAPSWWNFPNHRVDRLYSSNIYRKLFPDVREVSCGKCVECLKARQNDYLQVFYLAAKKYKTMHFVTLTYSNDTLPLSVSEISDKQIDVNTGEFVRLSSSLISDAHPFLRKMYFNRHVRGKKYDAMTLNLADTNYLVVPTLNRRDVRLWLKKMRTRYKDIHGENLPEFKYSLVPEMGSRTFRPHYHLLFFGISRYHLDWMCQQWREQYGFVCIDTIPILSVNSDSQKVANYVSKYVNKGDFECDLIKKYGDVIEKPRICSSAGLLSLSDEQINYLNGLDIKDLPENQIIERVLSRRSIRIGDFDYKLGRHILDKLTKIINYETSLSDVLRVTKLRPIYDEQGQFLGVEKLFHSRFGEAEEMEKDVFNYEVKSKTSRTEIQEKCKDFLQRLFDVRLHHELAQLQAENPTASRFEIAELYFALEKDSLEVRKQNAMESLRRFYAKTKF